jgi:hypothetical protein
MIPIMIHVSKINCFETTTKYRTYRMEVGPQLLLHTVCFRVSKPKRDMPDFLVTATKPAAENSVGPEKNLYTNSRP